METIDMALTVIKHILSLMGSIIIIFGAFHAGYHFLLQIFGKRLAHSTLNFDQIRLNLGRSIILGLEFIIAADVVATTTTPDYYALGILALLVLIRTFANYSLNKDVEQLDKTANKYSI